MIRFTTLFIFFVISTLASMAQDSLTIQIDSDTILLQEDDVLEIPLTLTLSGVKTTIFYKGTWNEGSICLEKQSPFTYEIIQNRKSSPVIFYKFLCFLKTGHTRNVRINKVKVKLASQKMLFKVFDNSKIKCSLKIEDIKELKHLRTNQELKLKVCYSLFLYNDMIVFKVNNDSPYMLFYEVKNTSVEYNKLVLGNFESNVVIIKRKTGH